jgi:hypothetical protein
MKLFSKFQRKVIKNETIFQEQNLKQTKIEYYDKLEHTKKKC